MQNTIALRPPTITLARLLIFSEVIGMTDSEQIAYIISLLYRLGLVTSKEAPNSLEACSDSQN